MYIICQNHTKIDVYFGCHFWVPFWGFFVGFRALDMRQLRCRTRWQGNKRNQTRLPCQQRQDSGHMTIKRQDYIWKLQQKSIFKLRSMISYFLHCGFASLSFVSLSRQLVTFLAVGLSRLSRSVLDDWLWFLTTYWSNILPLILFVHLFVCSSLCFRVSKQ